MSNFNIIFLLILNIFSVQNEKLIFVETLCRHGARAPLKLNEKGQDLLEVKWPFPGELTPIGKRMEYLLGLFNRHRYITGKYKFLSEKFDPHELVVFSSDANRTLLSIASQLQGLYPVSKENGDKLDRSQYNVSVPPFNLTYDQINDDLKELNDSALPNYMTIIPIHFIVLKNTTAECAKKIKDFNIQNSINKKTVFNFIEEFNKNYSEKLNTFHGRPKDSLYNFSSINEIFDTLIVDTTEGNDISEFFEINNIDKDSFIEKMYYVLTIYFRDYMFGDDDNEVILFYNSLIIKDMINYMKKKIEDDINGYPSLNNPSDYSRPKMVMLSGHDTTISAQEMFFIRFFDLGLDKYEYPVYTSQISYELTRDDDDIINKKKQINELNYSDYKVSYYLNNKLIMNITFDKFVERIEKVLWKPEQMDKFCFGDKNENEDDIDANLIIIISMGLIIFILSIIIIILIIKLKNKKNGDFIDEEKGADNSLINDEKEEE